MSQATKRNISVVVWDGAEVQAEKAMANTPVSVPGADGGEPSSPGSAECPAWGLVVECASCEKYNPPCPHPQEKSVSMRTQT